MEVKVNLSGSGLEYEGNVSFFQATQIMAFIAQQGDLNTPDQQILPVSNEGEIVTLVKRESTERAATYESPRAAFVELNAVSYPHKIIALALYLGATSQNGMLVETSEVKALFGKAGDKEPTHFNRELKAAISEGYAVLEGKNTFRLLSKTDKLASEKFPKATRKKSGGKSKSASSKEKLTVRDQVAAIPITSTLEGQLDFFSVKRRPDQILWILKYAQSHSLHSLNRVEILAICSKLGGVLSTGNFTSANQPNITDGHITTIGSQISISAKGEIYILDALKAE